MRGCYFSDNVIGADIINMDGMLFLPEKPQKVVYLLCVVPNCFGRQFPILAVKNELIPYRGQQHKKYAPFRGQIQRKEAYF